MTSINSDEKPKLDDSVFRAQVGALKGTYLDPDGCLYVCPGIGVPDDKVYSCERSVSLKALQREQSHHAALEVDRFARP